MSNVLGLSFCCSVEISCIFGAETVGTGRDVELCWSTRGYPRSPERSHKSLWTLNLSCAVSVGITVPSLPKLSVKGRPMGVV